MPKYKIEAFCDGMTLEFDCSEEELEEYIEMLESGEVSADDMNILHLGDIHLDVNTIQEEQ